MSRVCKIYKTKDNVTIELRSFTGFEKITPMVADPKKKVWVKCGLYTFSYTA